ncbi:MAG TPA: glycine--tRNA ligase subunit beta, partial [Vicinamibacterales bacterium]|nr:glycine--tRNA ligase subunit beta [Vicinamibacterales bacterium]
MDRELLVEIGTEEMPAAWLPELTRELADRAAARLAEFRLKAAAPVETFSTPRRLTLRVARLAERQEDAEELVTGPPVGAAFDAEGRPLPPAIGFARKQGVEVGDLTRVATPRGEYVAVVRRQRGRPAVDVLPEVLAGILRTLSFPRPMRWDAELADGRGELLFGRPIRWLLFLFGGRVVPFTIARTALARGPQVQDVESGAVTYGHRFLATSGRPGRSIKVRHFDEYRARLAEHFVILDRQDRRDRIARELELHARRLGGRVMPQAQAALLGEVPDLVEYPSVVAGMFDPGFLALPPEVLTTTLIRHQHFFPVVDDDGRLKPAFLAVTNTEPVDRRAIAANTERVVTARLRDARFFWERDRKVGLEARLERLDSLLFHRELGSYRAKAGRLERLAEWIAAEPFGRPDMAADARTAGRLAKADLATEMVREFTELQGTMGGIYAREEGRPETVWRAIYHHYLPVDVETGAPPSREELGAAPVTWAAVSLADKLDTLVGLFAAGEEPTGSRDPFGLRRLGHGVVRLLVDLPELAGIDTALEVAPLIDRAVAEYGFTRTTWPGTDAPARLGRLEHFLAERLRHLFLVRGAEPAEIAAVLAVGAAAAPLDAR